MSMLNLKRPVLILCNLISIFGIVAQLVEQGTFNSEVEGSSPPDPTED